MSRTRFITSGQAIPNDLDGRELTAQGFAVDKFSTFLANTQYITESSDADIVSALGGAGSGASVRVVTTGDVAAAATAANGRSVYISGNAMAPALASPATRRHTYIVDRDVYFDSASFILTANGQHVYFINCNIIFSGVQPSVRVFLGQGGNELDASNTGGLTGSQDDTRSINLWGCTVTNNFLQELSPGNIRTIPSFGGVTAPRIIFADFIQSVYSVTAWGARDTRIANGARLLNSTIIAPGLVNPNPFIVNNGQFEQFNTTFDPMTIIPRTYTRVLPLLRNIAASAAIGFADITFDSDPFLFASQAIDITGVTPTNLNRTGATITAINGNVVTVRSTGVNTGYIMGTSGGVVTLTNPGVGTLLRDPNFVNPRQAEFFSFDAAAGADQNNSPLLVVNGLSFGPIGGGSAGVFTQGGVRGIIGANPVASFARGVYNYVEVNPTFYTSSDRVPANLVGADAVTAYFTSRTNAIATAQGSFAQAATLLNARIEQDSVNQLTTNAVGKLVTQQYTVDGTNFLPGIYDPLSITTRSNVGSALLSRTREGVAMPDHSLAFLTQFTRDTNGVNSVTTTLPSIQYRSFRFDLPAATDGAYNFGAIGDRVEPIIEDIVLEDLNNTFVRATSGASARLIADTAGPKTIQQMSDLLRGLWEDRTIAEFAAKPGLTNGLSGITSTGVVSIGFVPAGTGLTLLTFKVLEDLQVLLQLYLVLLHYLLMLMTLFLVLN